jgi:RNA polymerase sigma factor (TIGR02999 family)
MVTPGWALATAAANSAVKTIFAFPSWMISYCSRCRGVEIQDITRGGRVLLLQNARNNMIYRARAQIDVKQVDWQHRAHFLAVSATLMRRILLDRARRRSAAKRGGKQQVLNVDAALDVSYGRARELIALDDALNTLAKVDPRKAQIVELRFFGGLSVEETAEVIKVSSDTIMRDWKLAKAWLSTELSRKD